jgi:hypothetical protein
MPTIRVHVRARDWERVAWRKQFEEDVLKVGWRLTEVEPPTERRNEYVVTLTRQDERAGL